MAESQFLAPNFISCLLTGGLAEPPIFSAGLQFVPLTGGARESPIFSAYIHLFSGFCLRGLSGVVITCHPVILHVRGQPLKTLHFEVSTSCFIMDEANLQQCETHLTCGLVSHTIGAY